MTQLAKQYIPATLIIGETVNPTTIGLSATLLLKSSTKQKRKGQQKTLRGDYRLKSGYLNPFLHPSWKEGKKGKLLIRTQLIQYRCVKMDPCGRDIVNLRKLPADV